MEALAAPPDYDIEKRTELTLDALKLALATPGEHRLFRWGKLPGLFPGRAGASGEAATAAVREGRLALVRTESKAKLVVEWVRITPAGVAWVDANDSPKAVLRELKELLDGARDGVPGWMHDAKEQAALLAQRFEARAAEMLARLDSLAARVDDALRRAEVAPPQLASPVAEVVPWGVAAMAYLDRRKTAGAPVCPLPELFAALGGDLPMGEFHDGLRRLHDVRAARLVPMELTEPEYAFVIEGRLVGGVLR